MKKNYQVPRMSVAAIHMQQNMLTPASGVTSTQNNVGLEFGGSSYNSARANERRGNDEWDEDEEWNAWNAANGSSSGSLW